MTGNRLALVAGLIFATAVSQELSPQIVAHQNHVRVYFVAADEVLWDYAASGQNDAMGRPFDDFENVYMRPSAHRIGRVYKKAIYREYTDAKFRELADRPTEEYAGILGPILRGEVGDTIKVVFKNNASRPYSMHSHGLLYAKDSEGAAYNDGRKDEGKKGDSVPPGATHVYTWEIPERAGPGPGDPSSVIWLYHSHVDEMRDVAAGLFGAIIVTARGKALEDGRPADVDREFVNVMITLNENESWYLNDNIRKFTTDPNGVNKSESIPAGHDGSPLGSLGKGFADTNLRNTINGYMYGAMPMMTMRKGDRVRWYLATLGD
ncbi:MAG TPA: multicopper oxidase domain-containing protein, partial [Candidatus Acidoferrum sp.]|nr:multicopper oxidase domain-containing protein [Candidatus Acidoferrum sp.]